METDIKSKLSTDLGLIKKRVESRVAELDELGEKCEHKHGVVVGRKDAIKDLPHKLLGGWKSFLQGRGQLVMGFSTWGLQQQTKRSKEFTSSFFLRPGVIKLQVVNFLLNIMYWVVRLFTLTLFVLLVAGVLVLFVYAAIEIIEFINDFRSKDPSVVGERR